MLSPLHFLRLPYHPSLTLGGIEYAKRSLHYTYNRMNLEQGPRLRKIVSGVAMELAFRRWLDAEHIPYDLKGATTFTDKDKYDLCLGGRKCDLKTFLITSPRKIAEIHRDPAWLLEAAALVPEDQFERTSLDESDLYLFGFLTGSETRQHADLLEVLQKGQPTYLLHTLSEDQWLGRDQWRSLGKLILKSENDEALDVEIGGQDEKHESISTRLRLEPHTRIETPIEFHSLLYVQSPQLPTGRVGVRSPVLNETHLIAPATGWENIWVYGEEVFVVGWLMKGEFRTLSQKLPKGSKVKQYPSTQTVNRSVPVNQLRSIYELTEAVKVFEREWRGRGGGEHR